MALIAVPAAAVEEAIRDCARAGVRSVVVISAGFGEVSDEGRQTEKRLRQLARSSGMRLVGPNCMGVINTAPDVSMNANFAPVWPPAGTIGLLSQSGALGYGILDLTPDLNIGISTFVSVGNKADVSVNDLLAYWAEDPNTKVIMMYLESFDHAGQICAPGAGNRTPETDRRRQVRALHGRDPRGLEPFGCAGQFGRGGGRTLRADGDHPRPHGRTAVGHYPASVEPTAAGRAPCGRRSPTPAAPESFSPMPARRMA